MIYVLIGFYAAAVGLFLFSKSKPSNVQRKLKRKSTYLSKCLPKFVKCWTPPEHRQYKDNSSVNKIVKNNDCQKEGIKAKDIVLKPRKKMRWLPTKVKPPQKSL